MNRFNFSTFFGNSGNSGLGSINFNDLALIRRGSYKKLMKSYYSKDKETTKNDKDDKTNKKTEFTDATGLTNMKKEADGLKNATETLNNNELWKQKNGEYDMDKIVSAVKTFVNEYNDVLNQNAKVSYKDVSQHTSYMTSLTKTLSGSLSKVGVTIGTDGKMSVDEETLKKADIKHVKELFSGTVSYVSQVGQKASAISSAALRNASLSGSLSGMFDRLI